MCVCVCACARACVCVCVCLLCMDTFICTSFPSLRTRKYT